MKYVSVTAPGTLMSKVIFNYFNNYLVSFGEAATNNSWNISRLSMNLKKILEEKPKDMTLYIDSGGFQIIMGYIYGSRIDEFIEAYHYALEKHYKNIDKIFGLDVSNNELDLKQTYLYNRKSTLKSIALIDKIPAIKDKQFYIMHTGSVKALQVWRKLFIDEEVYKHFNLWSFGGLVGLKKRTNAKFSHAVPATLWFLTYQKKYNFTIDQIHWLGQSSRLSFIAMGLFERLYKLNMTSDSSALVRFAPIDQKLPLIHKHKEDYDVAVNIEDIDIMLENHSLDKEDSLYKHVYDKDFDFKDQSERNYYLNKSNKNELDDQMFSEMFETRAEYAIQHFSRRKLLDNSDMTELQSQGIHFEIQFANVICDKLIEIGIENITTVDQLYDIHPILKRGRTAKELLNNIHFFNEFKEIVESGSVDKADTIMMNVVKTYEK